MSECIKSTWQARLISKILASQYNLEKERIIMKAMNWNEYVVMCNEAEAKRKAARKLMRDKHPTFCMIMDIISDIMIIVSLSLLAFSAIQWVSMKVEQFKCIINDSKVKTKFDRDRYEPIDEPVTETDNSYEE